MLRGKLVLLGWMFACALHYPLANAQEPDPGPAPAPAIEAIEGTGVNVDGGAESTPETTAMETLFPGFDESVEDYPDEVFPNHFEGDDAHPSEGDALSFQSIAPPPINDIDALIEIASLQIDTGEYLDAERALKASVKLTENRTSRYDPKLITPLVLLGDSRAGMGNYPEALEAYGRAVHLTRINEGLHSPEQVEVVYKEAISLAAMGDFEAANDRQEYAFDVLERAHGPYAEELVPGLYKLAAWYESSYNIFSARALYQYAAEALTRAHGATDPSLIPALTGIADTYRLERFPPYYVPVSGSVAMSGGGAGYPTRGGNPTPVNRYSNGERALRQVLKIQEENPEASQMDVVEAVLAVADWNLLFEKYSRAYPLYQYAQKMLAASEGGSEEEAAAYFDEPLPLYLPLPPGPKTPPLEMQSTPAEGFVELSYTVNERGSVGDLKTLASEPEGLMDIKVRRGMRASRFRPRFENGEPAETEDLTYRYAFRYYPKDEEDSPEAEEDAEPDEREGQTLAAGAAEST